MNKKSSIKKICTVAVFTAVIAALSQIAFPTPLGVSVTLQTFAISLTAFLLGTKLAVSASVLYVLLGAAGAPVFSAFSGGIGILLGASGGFIFAFPVFCLVLSVVIYVNQAYLKLFLCFLALILLYAAGIIQFILVSGNSFAVALSAFSLYFIKDILVVAAAYFLSLRIRPSIKRFIEPK